MDKIIVSRALAAAINKEAVRAARMGAKKNGYGSVKFRLNCLDVVEEAVKKAIENGEAVVRLTVHGWSNGLDVRSEQVISIYEIAEKQRFYLCEKMSISTLVIPANVEMVCINPPYTAEPGLKRAESVIRHARTAATASKLLGRKVEWSKAAKVELKVGDIIYILNTKITEFGDAGGKALIVKASVVG